MLFGLHQLASAQNKPVLAQFDSTSIRIGQQTNLRIFVHVAKSTPVKFPELKDALPSELQIVSLNKADTLQDANTPGQVTIRRNYVITGFDEGTYTVKALKFKIGNDSAATQPFSLHVGTVKVDTTKSAYDIKQPLGIKYSFWDKLRDNWPWIAGTLAIVALIAGVIIYLKKRPKLQPKIVEPPKPNIPPHVLAVKRLIELRDKKLWQMDFFKEYHSELTDIVRKYIEARYGLPTFEKTTDEILDGLRNSGINTTDWGHLQQIFTLADLVKFAKERPVAADNEQSLANAMAFVESTGTKAQAPREGGGADGVA